MKDLEDIKETLSQQKKYLSEKFNVKEIGIFGSVVRGEQGTSSDVDILAEFSRPVGFFAFLDLEEYLTMILEMKVDLVSRKALKPHIGKNILREEVTV
jgi:uncharacterized protein